MAIVTARADYGLDFRQLDLASLLDGDPLTQTSTRLVLDFGGGYRDEFTGVGFAYDSTGAPTAGTITSYRSLANGVANFEMTALSASAATFMTYVRSGDSAGGILFVLSGNDQITGSEVADFLSGGAGNDAISSRGGDDIMIGGGGDDLMDGGAGSDVVVYSSKAISSFLFQKTAAGWRMTDIFGGFGRDSLVNVEAVQFSDRGVDLALSNVGTATAAINILREPSEALAMLVGNGVMSQSDALGNLIKAADSTTSVATLSYQFFTGQIPGGPGYDYLVSPTGPNANNLNSAYYQSFNLENRYINFAVNLGKNGEGQAKFAAEYGGLSLAQATKKAYGVIFGAEPTDAKVAALLAGGRDVYFDSYGRDGLNGIGTKAAMVGWLLAEAEKADIGMYAKANAAFLTDLADGATLAVDLVGVYGEAAYVYVG